MKKQKKLTNNNKRPLSKLERSSDIIPLQTVNLNKLNVNKITNHCPFRFSDHKKPQNSPFAVAVVSPSSSSSHTSTDLLSPSSSYTLCFSPERNKPIVATAYEDDSVTITTPDHNTPMYSREIAQTGSGKKILVYSPTAPNSDSPITRTTPLRTNRVLFGNTSDEKDIPTLEQEYTFQCNTKNPNYSSKRICSQNTIMHASANQAITTALCKTLPTIKGNEWLHLIAYRFKAHKTCGKSEVFEPQSPKNLSAASSYANTKMLVLEDVATFLLKKLPSTFSIKVYSSCKQIDNSNNVMADKILQRMTILYNNTPILTIQQLIKSNLGLLKYDADSKQLAAMKDAPSLLAFVIYRLEEKLGYSPFDIPSLSCKATSQTKHHR